MSIRRGEVPFVAIRVGRSNDPREVLGLARDLKISRAEALGYVALWEEFILEVGDAMKGVVRGYTPAHVAAKLGFEGKPARLMDALKRAGVLAPMRGTFRHPTWSETPTGEYARKKAQDRETWRAEAAAKREAARASKLAGGGAQVEPLPDISPESGRTPGGRLPGISPENAEKERKTSGQSPPKPPAERGEPKGYARFRWLEQRHDRPINPEACARLLEALPDEDWPLVQWCFTPPGEGGPRSSSRKMRALTWPLDRFMRSQAYRQFRREWAEKLRRDSAPKNGHGKPRAPVESEADVRARDLALAVQFQREASEDPDLTPDQLAKLRRAFTVAYPNEPRPWEAAEPVLTAPA